MDAINQISHHLDPWSQAPGRRRPKSCCSCAGVPGVIRWVPGSSPKNGKNMGKIWKNMGKP